MALFSSLNREQKEAIGLLQIGTFLEYFDLMLYVHMAVVLNELFFPKTDQHTAALLAAFAFCSTFIFRPIGALIFGWMGDNIGRKSTIILTTIIMSCSCVSMANLPTYAEIGIAAAWIMTLCRMAQGLSSMGEIMGAEIYITESVPRPACYPAVASIAVTAMLGVMAALGVATLVTSFLFNWRLAFWIGAIIALIGAIARTRLRETPDFLELKRQKMQETIAQLSKDDQIEDMTANSQPNKSSWREPIKFKTLISFFFLQCGYPLSFYFAYIYFTPLLKESFEYSSENIIGRNFLLSVLMLITSIFWTYASSRVHPLRILKTRGILAFTLMILLPFLIINLNTSVQLFVIQGLILLLSLGSMPSDAVLIYHLPIFRRFTYASFLYALAYALMFIVTSFGLVYLGENYGPFGLWFITTPITIAYLYGVRHFEALERNLGIYPHLNTSPNRTPSATLSMELE